MGVSEKPRVTRGFMTIEMRKKVLTKAIKAAQGLLDDPNPEIQLSAVHAILQSVAIK